MKRVGGQLVSPVVAMADQVVKLPMLGSKQSLNVAVALSIATYWLRAQPVAMQAEQQAMLRAEVGVEVKR